MNGYIENIIRQWLTPVKDDITSLYLVGGAVRDYILCRQIKDIDLICPDAERFAKRLADTRDVIVVPFLKKADEPCYRVVDRQNSNSFVDITSMCGKTVIADLQRRDFTINAIAIPIKAGGLLGKVIDPHNGMEDIKKRFIRSLGPEAFSADPLRILRAVRLAAELDFKIEEATYSKMRKLADSLKNVASERILAELLLILSVKKCSPFIRLMDKLQVLGIIIPEIEAMKDCSQNSYHHLDVWRHSLTTLENCEYIINHLRDFFAQESETVLNNLKSKNRLPLIKLSAILHDIGKPVTRAIDTNTGQITFYQHDWEGEKLGSTITHRLRMSKQDRYFVRALIREHLHVRNLSHSQVKITTIMRWFRKFKDDSIAILILGMADTKATLGELSSEEEREKYLQWSKDMVGKYYRELKERLERRDFIRGKDLLALGMSPGPKMGRILKNIRAAQDSGLIKNRKDALVIAKKLIQSLQ